MIHNKQSQSGFALLISILLLAVIVTVTLSIIDLTRQQLALSVDGRDAEIAFQAASAGVECAQRVARSNASSIEERDPVTFDCFSENSATTSSLSGLSTDNNNNSRVSRYQPQLEWDNRCTEIDLIAVVTATSSVTVNNMQSHIANYPTEELVCPAGSVCHVVAAAGYNVPCGQINNFGVLKREMLLEF